MKNLCQSLLCVLFAAALAACGGGGSSGGVTNPTPGGAPTAAIADSQIAATALAAEASAADAAAQDAALAQGINLFGVPGGVITGFNCTVSGSGSVDAPASPSQGATINVTFSNCSFIQGSTINGTVSVYFDSYADASHLAFTATYNITHTGNQTVAVSGSRTCSVAGNLITCSFSHGGRTFESNFTYVNGLANGSYQWFYPNLGTVKFTFVNWTTTSGTITVLGANGSTATIVRTGTKTFTVTINANAPRDVMLP